MNYDTIEIKKKVLYVGWDLQLGELKEGYVTEDDIWKKLNYFFFDAKTTTTYKYGFFKALLENIYMTTPEGFMSYDHLFYDFTKIYWNLVVHHQLWQSNTKSRRSVIQGILEDAQVKYEVPRDWRFDRLPEAVQQSIVQQVKMNGKRYVIGAFYGDTDGVFYAFHLKDETLQMSLPVVQFLKKYQRLVTNLTNYQLAKFLEKYNEDFTQMLTRVEQVSQRASLEEFRRLLQTNTGDCCFYCGKTTRQTLHVDHFIPWDYVQSDRLWNFVLACPTCNTRKNNRVPAPQHLTALYAQNAKLQQLVRMDYFYAYSEQKLQELYQFATSNGYRVWE